MTDPTSRFLLKAIRADVRKHTTSDERKASWVISTGGRTRPCWEFHGPNRFYWYGRADGAYDARYKGWVAYLSSIKAPGYSSEEN